MKLTTSILFAACGLLTSAIGQDTTPLLFSTLASVPPPPKSLHCQQGLSSLSSCSSDFFAQMTAAPHMPDIIDNFCTDLTVKPRLLLSSCHSVTSTANAAKPTKGHVFGPGFTNGHGQPSDGHPTHTLPAFHGKSGDSPVHTGVAKDANSRRNVFPWPMCCGGRPQSMPVTFETSTIAVTQWVSSGSISDSRTTVAQSFASVTTYTIPSPTEEADGQVDSATSTAACTGVVPASCIADTACAATPTEFALVYGWLSAPVPAPYGICSLCKYFAEANCTNLPIGWPFPLYMRQLYHDAACCGYPVDLSDPSRFNC